MAKKKYASVSEMIADNAPSEEFRQKFETQVAKRRVIKHLIALRTARGMSQKDVADQVGCSQSRISKLEHGMDDDLRLGDLRAYARALGYSIGLLFGDCSLATAPFEVGPCPPPAACDCKLKTAKNPGKKFAEPTGLLITGFASALL